MGSRTPNDPTKKSGFVAKVWDETKKEYRPIYTLPDATDNVQGGVFLSDSTNDLTNKAADGIRAATPFAVASVNANANKKLDKETLEAQTVKGDVTFNKTITGDISGNAGSANKWKEAKQLELKVGTNGTPVSVGIDGSQNVNLTINSINASDISGGQLSLDVIPKAALERVITVANEAARFELTKEKVQTGDTVYQEDTEKMYFVVNDEKLNQAAGYQEYKVGTAGRLGTETVGSSNNVNHTAQAIWLDQGYPKPITPKIGEEYRPIYLNSGVFTEIGYSIKSNVPENAKFTDTTYTFFDARGFEPTAGYPGLICGLDDNDLTRDTKFLCGDGTWKVAGEVTGVKGAKEDSFRKGNVNLTPENVGALSLEGGILTGGLTTCGVAPTENDVYSLGTSTTKWSNVYASNFHGNLKGTADSANTVNNSIQMTGAITAPAVSMNVSGAWKFNTSIADKAVKRNHLDSNIGIVEVSSVEPTDPHVQIWIKP